MNDTRQYHKLYYWLRVSETSTSYMWKCYLDELGSWIKHRLDNQRVVVDDTFIFFAVTVQ